MPAAPVVPLRVLSHAQMVAQFNLTNAEFQAVLFILHGKERTLTGGKPGYFASDVEAALQKIRAGLADPAVHHHPLTAGNRAKGDMRVADEELVAGEALD